MIGSLRGTLLDRTTAGEAVVEAGGVGYRVAVPPSALAGLGELGSPVFLHVSTQVREDAIVLYGFPTRDERVCFEALLSAHGIGPSVALAILSVHSPASLRRALATDDVEALTIVPGIGRKTALRLLLELKTRLDLPDADFEVVVAGNGGGEAASARAQVRAALAGLGYGAEEVREAVRGLPESPDAEHLLRTALQYLAAAR